jgi:thioredoxin reductase (NADPH)
VTNDERKASANVVPGIRIMIDALIIGAGPAGLTAATYLGRYRRSTVVIDAGASRSRWIPQSHNIPGFPRGIAGETLLSELRSQAKRYGAQLRAGEVTALSRIDGGFSASLASGATLSARCAILATGVRDRLPALTGALAALERGVLRICPICDGYEAIGKTIAVLGDGLHARREAQFLRSYSDEVTLLFVTDREDPAQRAAAQGSGIEFLHAPLSTLQLEADRLRWRSSAGLSRTFDVVYKCFGVRPAEHAGYRIGGGRR